MLRKWANFFQLMQKLDVGLSDFMVLFIVAMGKGTTFGMLELQLFGEASAVECQLIFAFFSDFLKFAQMGLVESGWRETYSFCW